MAHRGSALPATASLVEQWAAVTRHTTSRTRPKPHLWERKLVPHRPPQRLIPVSFITTTTSIVRRCRVIPSARLRPYASASKTWKSLYAVFPAGWTTHSPGRVGQNASCETSVTAFGTWNNPCVQLRQLWTVPAHQDRTALLHQGTRGPHAGPLAVSGPTPGAVTPAQIGHSSGRKTQTAAALEPLRPSTTRTTSVRARGVLSRETLQRPTWETSLRVVARVGAPVAVAAGRWQVYHRDFTSRER